MKAKSADQYHEARSSWSPERFLLADRTTAETFRDVQRFRVVNDESAVILNQMRCRNCVRLCLDAVAEIAYCSSSASELGGEAAVSPSVCCVASAVPAVIAVDRLQVEIEPAPMPNREQRARRAVLPC